MQCPKCGAGASALRALPGGRQTTPEAIYRRRKCEACGTVVATVEIPVSEIDAFSTEKSAENLPMLFSGRKQAALRALVAGPRTTDELTDAIYPTKKRPKNVRFCTSNVITYLRRDLPRHGWNVVSEHRGGGRAALHRLVSIEGKG